jgi:NADH-quinone oxidoreductase subunit J
MNTFLFYIFSLVALLSAYFVVTVHNLFRAAMGLIGLLISVAGLYLLIDAQFLSAVQITVYVGGIVVLIVYVVLLMSDVAQKLELETARWRQAIGAVLGAAVFAGLWVAIRSFDFAPTALEAKSASVEDIGTALLSPAVGGFVLPFEIISLLLIAAIVGAITIARGGDGEKKEERK